ncbi:MAG: IgGFc-binding protein [Polyangiaceae bacterium]
MARRAHVGTWGIRGAFAGLFVVSAACRFDPSYRDTAQPLVVTCTVGEKKCSDNRVVECQGDERNQVFVTLEDCGPKNLSCIPALLACRSCVPGSTTCDGATVMACDAEGATFVPRATCDASAGDACRGGQCVNLCSKSASESSNVGCEYWAADLDNANISASSNAAAQQFAIVVSNVEADVPARVVVEEDAADVGAPSHPRVVGTAVVAPRNLEVFKLGPREIDGSLPGTFDTGTGTALSRQAYRVTSNVPIVAYQFNPLENVNVFSNDASQLLPTAALNRGQGRAYVVSSWPQTIANSDNPSTNFGQDLRAFLTLVGTRENTRVKVTTTARIVAGGPVTQPVPVGGSFETTLGPFEVLNLETGAFNADFTGTLVDADQPVVLFTGSEASDAPMFSDLGGRFCCADHLEEQAAPIRAIGKNYVVGRMPNRSRAVISAGGNIGAFDEPEYYRIVATSSGTTHVTTSLPAPDDAFDLEGEGGNRMLSVKRDFVVRADHAIVVSDTQASQDAAGVPRGLPGGDPSLVYVPPIEQWRSDYVLLTPDKYAFDFLVLLAPKASSVFVDGLPVGPAVCETTEVEGPLPTEKRDAAPYVVHRCQLSFPTIDPTATAPNNVKPGRQNDGVHRVQADVPVGVLIYGFDSYVSYAYAGGTQLTEINLR